MVLQIRTKDNLDELLRHGNSPSWVISEYRLQHLIHVEIYQFDGKKVLKGNFDEVRSTRTESGRLIVAFSNGKIEDADHKWVGQNPIKYTNKNIQNDTPNITTGSNLFNNIPVAELEKIQKAYDSKDPNIGQILKNVLDNNAFEFAWINSCSYTDIFEEIEKCTPFLFENDSSIMDKINMIENTSYSDSIKWHDSLVLVSTELNKSGGNIFSTVCPQGDYCYLVFPNSDHIIPIVLLYHFMEVYNTGMSDEYMEDKNISYKEFLIYVNGVVENIKPVHSYELEGTSFYGSPHIINNNDRYINLSEEIYNAALTGMLAAKGFC